MIKSKSAVRGIALAVLFYCPVVLAQTSGSVTNNALPIGKGPGTSGFGSLLLPNAQIPVGQTGAAPQAKAITGDITMDALGVTAIGTAKVTYSMIAAMTSAQLAGILSDETGTGANVFANSPVLVTPNLGTPSAVNLANGTALPVATGISGLGTNVAAFLATPSSTNLRAALTDEVGTGAAYFVGGALGTPASGTATNLTGLPLSTGVIGTLAAAQFPALTGDVTTAAGALATTLATVNSNVGSFGGVSAVPNFTVNAKGLITAAGSAAYQDATNAAKGVMRGDGSTITCVAGVCTSVGSAATSIAVGTTTVNSGTSTYILYNNAGTLGNIQAIPVANGGWGDTGTAWASYTPTATPTSGSLGSGSTTAGRYKLVGKTLFFQASVTTGTGTTATGAVQLGLPASLTAASVQAVPGFNGGGGANLSTSFTSTGQGYVTFSVTGGLVNSSGYFVNGVIEVN